MSVDRPFALVIDKDDKIRRCYCDALVEALEGLLRRFVSVVRSEFETPRNRQPEDDFPEVANARAVLKRVREGA